MSRVNHKPQSHPQGFTLVEFLFATIILGTLLTMAIVTFIGVFRFYVWAGTVRTNQTSSRELMSTITRMVAARKIVPATSSTLCLAQPNPTSSDKTVKLFLQAGQLMQQEYSYTPEGLVCNDSVPSALVGTPKIISNPSLTIGNLNFTQVSGALDSKSYLDENPTYKKLSVIIEMTVINGQTDGAGNCEAGDNFCDKSSFTTVASER